MWNIIKIGSLVIGKNPPEWQKGHQGQKTQKGGLNLKLMQISFVTSTLEILHFEFQNDFFFNGYSF